MLPDPSTRREIDRLTAAALRDAGLTTPPVRIDVLMEHLRVFRDYYDLEDPGFLDRAAYRVKVTARQLMDLVRRKVQLAGVWLPDENRILVDSALPDPKKVWASYHEITHGLLPWHRGYYLGDTAQMLEPSFQEKLEAEANYGASALIFCGARFTREAQDLPVDWNSVQALKKRYGASLQSTARRFVEHGPDLPMLLVTSTSWWTPISPDQPHRCRHLALSPRFAREFRPVDIDSLVETIMNTSRRVKGGPAGEFDLCLEDLNGDPHEFVGMHFSNVHRLLTLIVHRRKVGTRRLIIAS